MSKPVNMARRKLKQTAAARKARARYRKKKAGQGLKGKAKKGSGRAAFGLKGKGLHKKVRAKLKERFEKKKGGFLGTLLSIAAPILADVIGNAIAGGKK